MNPTPDQICAARARAGLTQEQAGALIGVARRTWQDYELGQSPMRWSLWELFNLKTGGKKS